MNIQRRRLLSKDQTGREMHRLISLYFSDLNNIKCWYGNKLTPFSSLPIEQAYNFVRKIPYRRDTKPIEVIARPREIMRFRNLGVDCKKKAILLASYLRSRGLPYRLVASSRLPSGRIHHVFPQILFWGTWLNFDATYPHYKPFRRKAVTNMEVLNAY